MGRIHLIDGEIVATELKIKAIRTRRTELVTELPEFKELEYIRRTLKDAEVRLKLAIREDPELAKLETAKADAAYELRDLKDQLSHNLTAYMESTGRDVIKDSLARNRHIDLIARLSKPSKRVLDQAKLPFSEHFGRRVTIPEAPAAKQLELMQENK